MLRLRGLVALWVAIGCLLLPCTRLKAEEPVNEFLDSLRTRGLYDIALIYLERLERGNLVSPKLKKVLPYERAKTLIQLAGVERDYETANKHLNDAQKLIRNFISSNSSHPLTDSAAMQLGNLLQARAIKAYRQGDEDNNQQLIKRSQQLYDEARKVFDDSIGRLKIKAEADKKKGFIDRRKDPDAYRIREELRRDYVQAQILAAAIMEEKADTFKEGSPAYKAALQEAAKRYGAIFEKYRVRMAGLYARLYEGRCYKKLENFKEAINNFQKLLEQPDNDGFREVKTEALQMAIECWMHPKENKLPVAIRTGREWLDKMRPNEAREPSWLLLQLTMARAQAAYGKSLQAEDPNDRRAARAYSQAREMARKVAKIVSVHQADARKFLVSLPGGEAVAAKKTKTPTTFTEAIQAARDVQERIESAEISMKLIPEQLAAATGKNKESLSNKLEQAKLQVAEGEAEALQYYQLALQLAKPTDSLEEVNICRYSVAYVHYRAKRYLEAAVIGDFVARRYPNSRSALQCARIAMSCLVSYYREAPDESVEFAAQKIVSICEHVIEQWPQDPAAIDATVQLIPFLIRDADYDRAEAYVNKLPIKAEARPQLCLQVGHALWRQFRIRRNQLRKSRKEETIAPDQITKSEQEIAKLQERAELLLKTGYQSLPGSVAPNSLTTAGTLSLAHAYLERSKPSDAVELLESKKNGLLKLVASKDPAVSREGFSAEVYKTALRSYVATLPESTDKSATIKLARRIMNQLKAEVSKDEAGQNKLRQIYFSLARELESQIATADSATSKRALAKGFVSFVNEVKKDAKDVNVLQWVAATFLSLGRGFAGDKELKSDADGYFKLAADSLGDLIDRAKQEKNDKLVNQLRWQLALTQREMGSYKQAMDNFVRILIRKDGNLPVQVDAAKTYQAWTLASPKDCSITKPLAGGYYSKKQKKNLVWGWSKLSKATGRNPSFREIFHESRVNEMICFVEYALRQKDKTKREDLLSKTKRVIQQEQTLRKDLGGPQWRARYDNVYRRIQKHLNEPVTGIPAPAKQLN